MIAVDCDGDLGAGRTRQVGNGTVVREFARTEIQTKGSSPSHPTPPGCDLHADGHGIWLRVRPLTNYKPLHRLRGLLHHETCPTFIFTVLVIVSVQFKKAYRQCHITLLPLLPLA